MQQPDAATTTTTDDRSEEDAAVRARGERDAGEVRPCRLKPSVLPSAELFTRRPYRIIEKASDSMAKKISR